MRLICSLCILVFSFLFGNYNSKSNGGQLPVNNNVNNYPTKDSINTVLLKQKAKEAFTYCKQQNMNQQFCLLANMNLHSGKTRIYVWDFLQQKVHDSSLVSHGCGNNPWGRTYSREKASFSNTDGSHSTALGKYSIGRRGYSQWGIHVNYLLYGLEKSNNNALARQVVLHSWEAVSDTEVYPQGSPEGWGCPAVSNAFMQRIDKRLKTAGEGVLLWMF